MLLDDEPAAGPAADRRRPAGSGVVAKSRLAR